MRWRAIWAGVAAISISWSLASAQQPIETHHARLMVQTGQSESVTSLAISPDGHYAVVAGGRAAVLWDVRSGKQLVQFAGHADRTEAVAFSPDGKYVLTGSDDHTACLWDATTGREIRRFVGHLDSVNAVAFAPDGKSVLTGSDDWSARLWDVVTGKELRRFVRKDGPHPPSTRYVAGEDRGSVRAVAFSPDGNQLVTCTEAGAELWDASTGRELQQFSLGDHQFPSGSVAFSPNGRWIATSSTGDGMVRMWDAQSGRQIWSESIGAGPEQSLAFSRNSQVLIVGAVADKPTATLLNAEDGKPLAHLKPGGQAPIALSPDGESLLTGSGFADGAPALLWSLKSGEVTHRLGSETSELEMIAVSKDGREILTMDHDAAQVWDVRSGSGTMRLVLGLTPARKATSPDGKTTLSIADSGPGHPPGNIVQCQDSAGNVRAFSGHQMPINALGFSTDGRYAFTQSLDMAQVWEVSGGGLVQSFPTTYLEAPVGEKRRDAAGNVKGEAILSPDGKWILSFDYSQDLEAKGMIAHLKDAKTGKEVRQLRGHTGEIISMAFSADSRYALTGSYDNTMRLWDVATGNLLQTYTGNTDIVMQVAFDGDSRYVLSGSLDGVTTIWNRSTGAAVVKLFSFRDGGWAVVDSQGHYDASDPDNSGSLYWVTDNRRSIDLGQLEKEYYTPGLLARALAGERLPDVAGMDSVALPPVLAIAQPYDSGTRQLQLSLTNDGGGVGKLLVKVNDRLVATLTPAAPADGQTATLPVDLSQAPFVEGDNTIRITAYDAGNRIESQDAVASYKMSPTAKGMTTVATDGSSSLSAGKFYAIIVGTSTFADPSLKLTFPAKDAANFAAGLRLGAERLYGKSNVWMRVLTSDAASPDGLPTKQNIRAAFDQVHKLATPEDTLVVYLSGHGVMSPSDRDLYYYLTADARTFDVEKDPALKDVSTVSSTELLGWLREPVKSMPGKEVIILDTCAAGGASEALSRLTEKREIPPDQRRAIEMLKDSTGTYILMGAAADAVSYEASKYGEGLLTYALLEGMRDGPFDDGSRLGVAEWFAHASERVPDLAASIGGIQKPEIAAPRGQGFPVAMLTVADRSRIPIALPKPQLLRVLVEDANQDDPLNLSDPLREQLRALNDVQTRGDGTRAPEAPVMYIDAADDNLAGVLAPKLLYAVSGDTVSVRVRLVRDSKTVAVKTVTGSTDDPQALVKRLTATIVALAVSLRP